MKTSKTKNNIENTKEAESRIQVASDYGDPSYIIQNFIMPELEQEFREQYEQLKKEGYKGSYLDFLKSEIEIKRAIKKGGGLVSSYKKELRKP